MTTAITPEIMQEVGKKILIGLSAEEACILCDVNLDDLKAFILKNKSIETFLQKKRIQFKEKHLMTISEKRSHQTSQWLLEKLLADEFGNKGKPTDTTNHIQILIKQIQNRDDSLVHVVEVPNIPLKTLPHGTPEKDKHILD